MAKKRRAFNKCELIDLRGKPDFLAEGIGVETASVNTGDLLCTEHHIRPFYGQGHIYSFRTETIALTLSRYKLNNDLVLQQIFEHDFIQVSFLLEGEKIIALEGKDDMLYEVGNGTWPR